jgi:hypothetical protein
LAAEQKQAPVHELEGDLQAFRLVDLERENLSEYRAQLEKLGIRFEGEQAALSNAAPSLSNTFLTSASAAQFVTSSPSSTLKSNNSSSLAAQSNATASRIIFNDALTSGSSYHSQY